MNPQQVFTYGQEGLYTLLMVAAPMLLTVLAVGLLVSIFQAATQINEMTLTFIPKLIVMFVVLVLLGPWTLELMVDFMVRLFNSIPGLIG